MIGGSIVVVACLLTLGWTAELVGLFISDEVTVRRSMRKHVVDNADRPGVA